MERILSNESQSMDEEASLRPQSLREYIGQRQLKENLSVFIEAASCFAVRPSRTGKNNPVLYTGE